MCSRSRTKYGISNRPKEATADDMIVDGIEKSTVPSLSLINSVSSSPNWLEPNTVTRPRSPKR